MAFVRFFYNPAELDGLFEDALSARSCPRARAPSTEAKRAASEHHNIYRPKLDLRESKETNTVTAAFELPGLTSEGIAVDVHQNRLTVSGEFAAPDSEEEKNYIVRERLSGKFSRTLRLPFGTKSEDVKAKMENGILTVTFPKTSPEQRATRIAVQEPLGHNAWVSV